MGTCEGSPASLQPHGRREGEGGDAATAAPGCWTRGQLVDELAALKVERPKPISAPQVISPKAIERRRTEPLQRLAEGCPVAREVLREMFPRAIQLQPEDVNRH